MPGLLPLCGLSPSLPLQAAAGPPNPTRPPPPHRPAGLGADLTLTAPGKVPLPLLQGHTPTCPFSLQHGGAKPAREVASTQPCQGTWPAYGRALAPTTAGWAGRNGPAQLSLLAGTPGLPQATQRQAGTVGPAGPTAMCPLLRAHLFLHAGRAARCSSGEEGGEVGVQRCLRLCAECQHLQARVEPPQLLLQAEGRWHRGCRERSAGQPGRSAHSASHAGVCWGGCASIPGWQRVVGHEGKVQEGEEILGSDHTEAFGQVWVHPAQQKQTP